MTIRVNLSEAGEGFDPIPASRYVLNIFDGELREAGENAKHPGSQYIAWDLTVASGEFEGRHIWTNTVVDHGDCECGEESTFNKGLFALRDLLKASGKWLPEELAASDFNFEIEDLTGSVVAATVGVRKSEEYGDQNTIKRFRPLGDAELESLSALP